MSVGRGAASPSVAEQLFCGGLSAARVALEGPFVSATKCCRARCGFRKSRRYWLRHGRIRSFKLSVSNRRRPPTQFGLPRGGTVDISTTVWMFAESFGAGDWERLLGTLV